MITRIAMWSGPRNISTAMMYSFGNRPDCEAWDEPFYAFSLKNHGNDHPLRDEIMAAYEQDYSKLVALCLGHPPSGKPVFYQKHMTHHMLEGFARNWILKLENAFLIRDPARVLASYVKKWQDVTLRDIGYLQQQEIFDMVAAHLGHAPPVLDCDEVLANPRTALSALCKALNLDFCEEMLHWPSGPKPFDGIWAKHWYNAAWQSEGFEKPDRKSLAELPARLQAIADAARPVYENLKRYSLSVAA